MDIEQMLEKARKTNKERDVMDRSSGFAALPDLAPFFVIRTAVEALKAGIVTEDWNCVAEAAVMLEDLEKPMRAVYHRAGPQQ